VGFVLINIHSPTLIFIAESNVCGGFSLWPVNLINPLEKFCALLLKLAIFLLVTLTHVATMLSHYRRWLL